MQWKLLLSRVQNPKLIEGHTKLWFLTQNSKSVYNLEIINIQHQVQASISELTLR